jgi:hypothetical protein
MERLCISNSLTLSLSTCFSLMAVARSLCFPDATMSAFCWSYHLAIILMHSTSCRQSLTCIFLHVTSWRSEFQDPKIIEVLYHIEPYFGCISPHDIALTWDLCMVGTWNGHWSWARRSQSKILTKNTIIYNHARTINLFCLYHFGAQHR